jgi:SRSO17 transposase
MLPIVKIPSFIETILPRYSTIFNKAQLRHFSEYLTGLIVSTNKTITGINSDFLYHTDQSSKNHFLTEANWDEQKVTDERLCMVKEQCEKHHIDDGILVIDDSLSHKSGMHIEGANWFWDHAEHVYSFGHQLVTSQYVTKKFHVPLHYRLYLKEEDVVSGAFQSKIDLAIQLINEAATAGIPFNCVAADSWYFCDTIIKYLASLGKEWVFASKSNRIIFVNNRWMQLKEFLETLTSQDFKKVKIQKTNGKELCVWAFARTVHMKKVGRVKVVISFLKEPFKGDPFFLVTNRKEWSIMNILSTYAQRWPIETFYRDAKQNLGLEDCEMRLLKGIRRHWDLVFLAYTLLQFESLSGPLNKWIKSNVVTIGDKCRLASAEILRSFIFFAYQNFNQNYTADHVFCILANSNPQLKLNLFH